MRLLLPPDPEGYAVDASLGVLHSRYAAHAADLPRTRTQLGARTLADGADLRPCELCYPAPVEPAAPKPPTRRRQVEAAPAPEPEPELVVVADDEPDERVPSSGQDGWSEAD